MTHRFGDERLKEFEDDALMKACGARYILRLYVAGATRKSVHAIAGLRKICDEYLRGRFDLEVIDIYQQPILAKENQIIAAPTLIKEWPTPQRKFIGDLSNIERIVAGLGLQPGMCAVKG